jgi:hypothetical protein
MVLGLLVTDLLVAGDVAGEVPVDGGADRDG